MSIAGEDRLLKYQMNGELGLSAGLQDEDVFEKTCAGEGSVEMFIDDVDQGLCHYRPVTVRIVLEEELEIKVEFARFIPGYNFIVMLLFQLLIKRPESFLRTNQEFSLTPCSNFPGEDGKIWISSSVLKGIVLFRKLSQAD